MIDRDQQLIEAAMEYLVLFESETLPNVDEFIATVDVSLQTELRAYLEDILASDSALDVALSEEEQRLAEQMMTKERERLAAELQATASPTPTLTDVRLQQRLSLGALAKRLNLPVPLLDRLERGGVLLSSLPDRLVELLAETLAHTQSEIQAILAASQFAASNRLQEGNAGYLSARDGATIGAEQAIPFDEVFMSSAPSPEQRAFWEAHLDR